MEAILEQIKFMNYDELYKLQDAILDKYDDIDRQEQEEYYKSMEEYNK